MGKAYLYTPFVPHIGRERLEQEAYPQAEEAFQRAILSARRELEQILEELPTEQVTERKILQAHLEILLDGELEDEIRHAMWSGENPAMAMETVFGQYMELMQASANSLMQERAADFLDVRNRLLRNLAGIPEKNLRQLTESVIVVAHDLMPGDTATMDRTRVMAIVTEVGGRTSHTAILARSYGIPAAVGVEGALEQISDGMPMAVDGKTGTVTVAPDAETTASLLEAQAQLQQRKEQLARYLCQPCTTADGTRIQIGCNLGADLKEAAELEPCVDLVGLFRTEFLYMQGSALPAEEAQYQVYCKLLECYGDKPVVLRTLDVGGDKELTCLHLPKEENPFLGKRALRLCLGSPEIFRFQLRAALRASVHGNLWIMFPMVASLEDWRRARQFTRQVQEELKSEGIAVSETVRFGIMIEVPAAVEMADELAAEVDFASIGSNDLCQYALAVDRGNPAVAEYYQMYAPAVFRMIGRVIQAFDRAGTPISICGELSGDVSAAMALVGLGMRKLSMSGGLVAAMKEALAGKTLSELEETAARVLRCRTAEEIKICLRAEIEK